MRTIYIEFGKKLEKAIRNKKAQIIISEIGYEHMVSATGFVIYMHEKYGVSESTLWYTLKRLKKEGLLDFGTRGEGKPLELTKAGIEALRSMIAMRVRASASLPGYGIALQRA